MAIEYGIDNERRLLRMKGRDTLTAEDLLGYLRDVVSHPDALGYGELMDLREVREIIISTFGKIQLFAQFSKIMNSASQASRLAIVSSEDDSCGLKKIYEKLQAMQGTNTREIGSFRSIEDALVFLKVEGATLPGTAATCP